MTSKLLKHLTSDELKVYHIAYDSGKQKGTVSGFIIGLAVGGGVMLMMVLAIIC